MNNNISFKGTFKFNIATNDYKSANSLYDLQDNILETIDYQDYVEYPSANDDITKFTYVIPDSKNSEVENFCIANGIKFKKCTQEELTSENAVKSRMIVPEFNKINGWQLVEVDIKKFNDLYKKEIDTGYVGDSGKTEHPERCNSFKEYLKSGLDIEAPQVFLREENGDLRITFQDGRHRYSVLRDELKFKSIPLALDQESIELAKKYELIT